MAIVRSISRLFRCVTIAAVTVAGPTAQGLGSACAGEAVTEVEASGGATLGGLLRRFNSTASRSASTRLRR